MSPEPLEAANTGLRLQTRQQDGDTTILCAGRLTLEHVEILKSQGKAAIPQCRKLVLDLAEVTQMDSAGLGAVVGLYISAKKAKCDFLLVNYNSSIKKLLGISHLLSVFEACAQTGMRMP